MTCGTLALLHMAFQLGFSCMVTDDQIVQLHQWLLTLQTSDNILYAGGNEDLIQSLAQLLSTKGVPVVQGN